MATSGRGLRGFDIVAGLCLAGCPPVANPYLPPPEPDYDEFVARVQPVVGGSCAFLGCHGTHERALALYAVDFLRAEQPAGSPIDPVRMSDDELLWNYDGLRLRLIDETSADDSALLLKCLDPALGGIEHAGGTVVFASREDHDFLVLRDWISGGL